MVRDCCPGARTRPRPITAVVLASLTVFLGVRSSPGQEGADPTQATASGGAASGPGERLEEVVVTARRRSESLQQVPIAIAAIEQDTLERYGVQTLSDLQLLAPSAYVSEYAHGSGQQFFSLRGQSESGLNTGGGAGGGPGVVGYFSEVPTQMAGPGLYYDLQSVEVIVETDRKSTRLNSSHVEISYAVFCLKKKKKHTQHVTRRKLDQAYVRNGRS